MENILQQKTFMHPLGLQQNFIAGTKWAIPSRQHRSILPACVANHSIGFGSSCSLTELIKYVNNNYWGQVHNTPTNPHSGIPTLHRPLTMSIALAIVVNDYY